MMKRAQKSAQNVIKDMYLTKPVDHVCKLRNQAMDMAIIAFKYQTLEIV